MKTIVKGLALSAVAGSMLMAGGYKIPEQSLNSMALGAAYVAHTSGADTAYFNPANMAFMEDKQYIEGGLTLAHLPQTDYVLMAPYSGNTETENIVIPNLHYVSNAIGDFRWGVSLTAPGGLTKKWNTPYQKAFAQEFTLKILELNPSVSYKVMDNLSIGAGVGLVYSTGVVKSDATSIGMPLTVNMDGDTVEFRYNLALSYKPTTDIMLAATYRSNVDLKEEGTATINGHSMDASVTVPLPAALNIAASKTWANTFTLEAVYERTYWSTYKNLEFVGTPLPVTPKNWQDTNTFRIGATMVMDKITMMMGFAIDETPVPVENLGFELPDSDAKIFSMGFRYQQTENLSWGAALLVDSKDSISMPKGVNANPVLNNGGSFNGGGAVLTTLSVAYEF
ncbi:Outer membrane protein assembly factor YaeT precursor [hydrothermal vent metagenome]|uniref:Outer membrane protein assembly factor YaeT n=1 Tax=hydrothermal vent metagenome TaxID=652676 RepID=A0A1W1CI95_9ZZZZ